MLHKVHLVADDPKYRILMSPCCTEINLLSAMDSLLCTEFIYELIKFVRQILANLHLIKNWYIMSLFLLKWRQKSILTSDKDKNCDFYFIP